jgi:predicted 3-demethylubiquinone-9 3-methyltransferase (glyoxalase superfamily)
MAVTMQKITPFLWFDSQAEAAARFTTSIFADSGIGRISRHGDSGPGPKGSVMAVTFRLEGQEFMALNGGPRFKLTEAFSMVVNCETQDEVDNYWEKLSAGGQKSRCGWLKDRYGLSWQIVPALLGRLVSGPDPGKSNRVMAAVLKMNKLDIKVLQQAHEGR